MCGHCRAIVLGAFVVGALAGALTGSLVLDKKYKEAYAREVEASRSAAKRVIKSLRDKLEEKSRVVVSEEDEKEMDEAAELEGQQAFDDYLEHVRKNYINDEFAQKAHGETSKTDSEKIPEGKNETPIVKGVEWPDDPEVIDYRYVPSMNKWFNGDGDARSEEQVRNILGDGRLKAFYEFIPKNFKPADIEAGVMTKVRGYLIAVTADDAWASQ